MRGFPLEHVRGLGSLLWLLGCVLCVLCYVVASYKYSWPGLIILRCAFRCPRYGARLYIFMLSFCCCTDWTSAVFHWYLDFRYSITLFCLLCLQGKSVSMLSQSVLLGIGSTLRSSLSNKIDEYARIFLVVARSSYVSHYLYMKEYVWWISRRRLSRILESQDRYWECWHLGLFALGRMLWVFVGHIKTSIFLYFYLVGISEWSRGWTT